MLVQTAVVLAAVFQRRGDRSSKAGRPSVGESSQVSLQMQQEASLLAPSADD